MGVQNEMPGLTQMSSLKLLQLFQPRQHHVLACLLYLSSKEDLVQNGIYLK